jgi:type I restriction enzyme S subunit
MVTLKSFARGGGYRQEGLKSYTGPYKFTQEVTAGEVVLACTDVTQAGEVIGRPALVRPSIRFDRLVASQDVAIVRPRSRQITPAFLYFALGTHEFTEHARAYSTGTTVLHLDTRCVPAYPLRVPPAELLQRWDEFAARTLSRIALVEQESASLAAIRDTLLPRLISGDLRLKDADQLVEAVSA